MTTNAHGPAPAVTGLSRLPGALFGSPVLQLGLILIVALATRLVVNAGLPVFLGKDSQSYFLPAWQLTHGEPFELGLRRTPVYPFFLAATILAVGEAGGNITLLQHLLGAGTAGLAYLLGYLAFGRLAGLLAGLLVALNGPLIIYEHYVMTETLFTFLLALSMLLALIALRRLTPVWLVATGAVLGAAVLARPVAQVLLPLVPLALLAQTRLSRITFERWLWFGTGLALILVPWMIRNAVVHDSFSAEGTLGQTLVGRTIKYDDYRKYYTCPPVGETLEDKVTAIICEEGPNEDATGGPVTQGVQDSLGLGEAETSAILRQVALEAIGRNPMHYVRTTGQTFFELLQAQEKRDTLADHLRLRSLGDTIKKWTPGPMRTVFPLIPSDPVPKPNPNAAKATDVFRPAEWWVIQIAGLVLALLLAVCLPRYRPALLLLLAVVGVLLSTALVTGPLARYRYPVDPLIAVLVAGGLVGAAELLAGRLGRQRRAGRGAAARSESPLEARPVAAALRREAG